MKAIVFVDASQLIFYRNAVGVRDRDLTVDIAIDLWSVDLNTTKYD
jgi:hypothetical protein